jgi:hypothetical protein
VIHYARTSWDVTEITGSAHPASTCPPARGLYLLVAICIEEMYPMQIIFGFDTEDSVKLSNDALLRLEGM